MTPSLRIAFVMPGLAALLCLSVARGQEPPEPGAPPDGTQAGEDYEVYNRGPLHEAFATPGTNEPVRGEVIDREPPEPIDEIPPEQKPEGENVVWVPGYWAFDEELDDFLWVSGVWRDIPPGRTWVPGYWTETAEGFQWVAGMWADTELEQVTYLPEPPESLEHGPSSPSPGEGYFWVPGHWDYQTDYRWRPGYWAPHQRDWIWVPACYTYTPRGYVFVPGYWDYQLAYRGLAFAPVYFHRHSYHRPFAPTVALDSWGNLMLHLFVNPRYGRYYFGDYYGPRYTNYGYTPFYSWHRHSGYDPLFVYFSWRFGNDYYDRLDGWHRYFAAHDDLRPRRTFREQRQFLERQRDNRVIAATSVAAPLEDVVRSAEAPIRFAGISGREREGFTEQARQLQHFARERLQVEARQEGQQRTSLRIQGNERLRLRRDDGRDEGRQRVEAPERPDQMRDIRPDSADGRRARIPSRHTHERPDVADQPGRSERPDVREQPGQRGRRDIREQPDPRGRRELPRLPDNPRSPEAERGQRELPDRGPSGERPERGRRGPSERSVPDRGAAERGASGEPQERSRRDRGSSPERSQPERRQPDRGERERPEPGRRDRSGSERQGPERGQTGERPPRGGPDRGTS